jgi:hypothetical protein
VLVLLKLLLLLLLERLPPCAGCYCTVWS